MPDRGSNNEDIIFMGVGRALSAWERFEWQLAIVFGLLVSRDGDPLAARRAYGSVVSFRGRTDMVLAASRAAFWQEPGAEIHKELENHIIEAGRFSARRNEIAHGVVDMYDRGIPPFIGGHPGFALGPARYATNKIKIKEARHALEAEHLAPGYAYSAPELAVFSEHFQRLCEDASRIVIKLFQHKRAAPP